MNTIQSLTINKNNKGQLKFLFVTIGLLFITSVVHANPNDEVINSKESNIKNTESQKDNKKEKHKKKKKYNFINTYIPVIGANPTNGTVYGLALVSAVTLGNPKTTKMTTITGNAIRTSKKQTMILVKSVGYTDNNEWMFLEDGRAFFSSQDTFGLGTGPTVNGIDQVDLNSADAQPMDFDLFRFHFTAAKQIKPSLYFGVGYHFDQHKNIKDLSLISFGESQQPTSHFEYSTRHGFDPTGYTTSGISANLIYDTRDNVSEPYKGTYAFGSYKYFPEFLGSDQNASTLWLEFRDYFRLSKTDPRKLLTFWSYYSSVTSGNLPYMDLPAVGWDQFGRSGRGYTQGRFRGEDIFYAELELRMPLRISKKHPERYGYTIFANTTTTSNDNRNQDLFEYFQPAAGVGLRILVNEKSRATMALDIGVSANGSSGFYFNFNESF